jgi:hypothetical protein
MSASVRERPDDRKTELETVVNWPTIAVAIGSGLVVLTVLIVVGLLSAARPAPEEEQALARRSAAPVREAIVRLPALPEPRPQPRETLPQPTVVVTVPQQAEPQTPPVAEVKKPSPAPIARRPVAVAVAPPVTEEKPEEIEAPAPPSYKQRYPHAEYQLLEALEKESREIDIETEKGTTEKLLASKTQPMLEMLAQRADLKGLPVRKESECQLGMKEAVLMGDLSSEVRSLDRTSRSSGNVQDFHRDAALMGYLEKRTKRGAERDATTMRTFVQMLQVEKVAIRLELIKMLSAVKGDKASVALAQRAVFDLSAEVREAAVKALKDRPAKEYRSVLLEAFRYPWDRVADRAAEALVNLDDLDAAPDLVNLLDKPDPRAPVQNEEKKWVVSELVKVNHLANCYLCHAPSSGSDDPVRGVVPERGKPLPVMYYGKSSGSFVRADVTYLKQDFSVIQPVSDYGKWPQMQRFDYLVRKRELSAEEVECLECEKECEAKNEPNYPQREAVLWALRELTGKNAGDKSEGWYKLLLIQRLE